MTAVRLDKPATLPAKKGATIILIPISSGDGTPKVRSEELAFGEYARVDAEDLVELVVDVKGTAYCLLLLCQP
jgi:hypothetical protein